MPTDRTSSASDRPDGAAAPEPAFTLRTIAIGSQAILATVAVGFALYAARGLLQPIAAAFVVGVTLSPGARRLEALHVPRPLAALLMALGVTLTFALVIGLVVPRVSEVTDGLPGLAATLRQRLQALDGFVPLLSNSAGDAAGRLDALLPTPSLSWLPSTIDVLWPPIQGFLFFFVVLLLFIVKWPDLRKGLVMTFASRDSRLTVLKILNDVETGLANYLRTVTLINLGLGAVVGAICALAGMPHAVGFGALTVGLNFIPILGPIAMFVILLMVGIVAVPSFALGLVPAAGFALTAMIEGQFVTPTIVGRQLELNGLALILSLAFWAWLWGPIGAFLASPILIIALIVRQRLSGDDSR